MMTTTTLCISLIIVCFAFPCQLLAAGGGAQANNAIITAESSIRDPQTISSPGNVFKLGFYSPNKTANRRYLAIFYFVSEETVVWVANRENPLTDSSGKVAVSNDGNLVLVNGKNETIWSTNVTTAAKNASSVTASLRDNGNLVLLENSTGSVLWDSFLHPANVYLPGMAMIDDTLTGERVVLSSWKNDSDPGIGIFTGGLEAGKLPQLITRRNGKPHFRSGPWNGQILIGMAAMYTSVYNAGSSLVQNPHGVFNLTLSRENFLARTTMKTSGVMERTMWNGTSWDRVWGQPENECDIYGKCGPFGTCDTRNVPMCSCLKGFEPADRDEWDGGNWTSGCVRRKVLGCNGDEDRFFEMQFMKVPDFAEPYPSNDIDECRLMCLSNCSCIAYAHDPISIGCMFWWESDGLVDTQQFSSFGVDLYIRLEKSELDNQKEDRRKLYIVVISATVGGLLLLLAIFVAWCCYKQRRKERRSVEDRENPTKPESVRSSLDATAIFRRSRSGNHQEELKLFTFETLQNATNQFHEDNMIGKGGFGHVYKGKLSRTKEIAVKRLSETSKQGTEEFMNEVVVISKLQHKNLVRLFGCCVEKDERMLIYEYMPNKSLDICLFDPSHPSTVVLDWKARFNIIEGIGRGLVYLHRDSRMRIIHRDLKPSNILLDKEWNPKISDFGMAKIFGDNQEQGDTLRVVGTHGYMAPEYALEGRFSEKSDIYSFGILMLEIVSGKKSIRYYNSDLSLNLLGCAWKFWHEDNCMAFADQNMAKSSSSSSKLGEEIGRCIQIGLLCVQEFVEDRPTTQTVLSMLNGEILDLPVPRQPLLAKKMDANEGLHAYSTQPNGWSVNQLTITALDGR